ncbi:RNA-binding domain-containing protein [Aliidiomarina sanyensis]|uniref:AAA family ATPase n=1 Tax=Aliidiomarina sanyensis TaxID=1249555 RepID=A0A432WPH5_9GAMM|nr:RNA-binding domain-containing protein [Aliidiomarina sanyensis]RUO35710.1 AAA family ATPase [Aliidiomarina sanyensis]
MRIDNELTIISELKESNELEFKRAQSELPTDFWPTYSAFANTNGGIILLGITEIGAGKHKSIEVTGVKNPETILKQLFDQLNNSQKVSCNLLTDESVEKIIIDEKVILKISIPKADRKLRPVFIKQNPKLGTYVRHHEGDYQITGEALQRMYAEQGSESRDAQLLRKFDLSDLDKDTLQRYRQQFSSRNPEHPFNGLENKEFLRQLGGWKIDRETGEEGLTLAGLLMFGRAASIKDHLSHFHLDYLEREEADRTSRYIDRVTIDGTWSGNLFDFYLKVYRKLTENLKITFRIKEGTRSDSSPVHVAIREALVNTLAHADFACTKPVTVVKRPDMFGFRNPGLMRIPIERAIEGGLSDCRNSNIHDMFRMIGLSERLGSGVSSIYRSWSTQHWQPPKLYEMLDSEQTLLELRMIELVPAEILDELYQRFGESFHTLSSLDRTIIVTAACEKWVNHERVMQLTSEHSREVTLALPRLERNGFLTSTGSQKAKFYTLPGESVATVDEIFQGSQASRQTFEGSSEGLNASSEGLSSLGSHSNGEGDVSTPPRDSFGRLIIEGLDKPFIDDLNELHGEFRENLYQIAQKAHQTRKLSKDTMHELILKLCEEQYLSRTVLATLLSRSPDALRQSYLTQMIRNEILYYAFPQQPTHEKQGYIASPKKQ